MGICDDEGDKKEKAPEIINSGNRDEDNFERIKNP
jgi:hypothetical protein